MPIAAAAVIYLLVLDVANRHRTRPPFWGAAELQAQFMGLGNGEDPCPLSPPPSSPPPPPHPFAPPPLPRAPAAAEVTEERLLRSGWPAVAWPTHTPCSSLWNQPQQWLFKYIMWSWLFVVEALQGHATVLLVLLQALLEFSFTMDAGRNNDVDAYWFCCSSYAYFFFFASGLVAAIDVAMRRRRRRQGRKSLALPLGLLVGWLASALGTLAFDGWDHSHHFLAFLVGTLCALLNMLVVREREVWRGPEQRASLDEVVVEPEEST